VSWGIVERLFQQKRPPNEAASVLTGGLVITGDAETNAMPPRAATAPRYVLMMIAYVQ
jgi:hypothetical protein